MSRKKPLPRQMLKLCAEISEDDGIDPRDFFRGGKTPRKVDRKTLQLCSQILDTLTLLFSGAHDALLQGLQVASVVPAPNASQLLVTVFTDDTSPAEADAVAVMQKLNGATSWIRCEVASAITRKRAPKLLFHWVDASPDHEVGR